MAAGSVEKYIAKTGKVWVFIISVLFAAHVSVYLGSKPGELNEWLEWPSLLFPFFLLHTILIAKIRCALSPIMEDDDTLIGYIPLLNTFWLLRISRRTAQYLGLEKIYRVSVAGTLVCLLGSIALYLSDHRLLGLISLSVGFVALAVLGTRIKSIQSLSLPILITLMACLFAIICIGYFFAPGTARLSRILLVVYIQFMGGLTFTDSALALPPPPAASQEAPSP